MKVHYEKLNFIKSTLTGCLFVLLTIFSSNTTHAQISYSEDFESFATAGADFTNMGGDWKLFVNVFSPTFAYLSGYGPFPAPNHNISSSNIGAGGATGQFLNVFSDYNNSGAHLAGQFLETNIFQERTISAGDEGEYTFSFDHVLSGPPTPVLSDSLDKLFAFIKVIGPAPTYSTLVNEQFDVSSASSWTKSSITATLDASMVGSVVQWGFASTATKFAPSGVWYDNLSFGLTPAPSAGTDIPTLGEWGLISLSLILMIFGINLIRQRKNQLRLN